MRVEDLIEKCAKWWWSPNHPDTYVLTGEDAIGLGRLASQSYGAFNLTYLSVNGELRTCDEHLKAIKLFGRLQALTTRVVVDGALLDDTILALTPREFLQWYVDKRDQFLIEDQSLINRAIYDVRELPTV